ncbi:hypothetical protein LINGRAHAP2_LOCUS22886 [Linum grandiflorum]
MAVGVRCKETAPPDQLQVEPMQFLSGAPGRVQARAEPRDDSLPAVQELS